MFETGNSGNHLYETVLKIGPEAQQEGSYCQFLGEDVCPKVYAIIPNGYIMEKLEPATRNSLLLFNIERLLTDKVWSRPALPSTIEIDWRIGLKSYGVEIPDWIDSTEYHLVHGDPTASNALQRNDQIIMCDPRPPRSYIPQYIETDMGRIVQSMMGWEVAAYSDKSVDFVEPRFWYDETFKKKAIFWCGAAAARIEHLERSRDNRRFILDWCMETRQVCNV